MPTKGKVFAYMKPRTVGESALFAVENGSNYSIFIFCSVRQGIEILDRQTWLTSEYRQFYEYYVRDNSVYAPNEAHPLMEIVGAPAAYIAKCLARLAAFIKYYPQAMTFHKATVMPTVCAFVLPKLTMDEAVGGVLALFDKVHYHIYAFYSRSQFIGIMYKHQDLILPDKIDQLGAYVYQSSLPEAHDHAQVYLTGLAGQSITLALLLSDPSITIVVPLPVEETTQGWFEPHELN